MSRYNDVKTINAIKRRIVIEADHLRLGVSEPMMPTEERRGLSSNWMGAADHLHIAMTLLGCADFQAPSDEKDDVAEKADHE